MKKLTHEFVESIPEKIEEGRVYISIKYETVIHKCACGCGNEVVTPLSPTDWCMMFDGESVSLDPSIGNWSFPCRSHYWIRKNEVRWSYKFSEQEIKSVRRRDAKDKAISYAKNGGKSKEENLNSHENKSLWSSLKSKVNKLFSILC